MPHQCTECSRTFPDGSKEMLSGCPDCGGNKFQFKPADAVDANAGAGAGSASAGGASGGSAGGGASAGEESSGAMSRAKTAVRDLVSRGGDDGASSSATDPISSSPSDEVASAAENASGKPADSASTTTDSASARTDSASATGGSTSPRASSGEGDGERSWPKSGTEEYDTPAEQAVSCEDVRDDGVDATAGSEAGAGADATAGSETGAGADATAGSESSASAGAESDAGVDAGTGAGGRSESSSSKRDSDDRSGITAQMDDTEDDAQRSARSEVVSPDELPNQRGSETGPSAPSPGDASRGDASRGDDSPGDVSSAGSVPNGSAGSKSSASGVDRADRPPSRGESDMEAPASGGEVASEPSDDSPDLDELREELNSQFESIKVVDPGKYELNLMELYDREEYIISLQEDGRYVIEVPESWRGDASPD